VPRQIVRLVLAVLILASLFGGRSLVANIADGAQHVVKPGETLSGIAAQYGLTVDQLAGLNGITDPDRVTVGQGLKLPAQPATASQPPSSQPVAGSGQASPKPAGTSTEYVVQAGDNMSAIAKSLGVSLRALLEANGLDDPDRLKIGQKLTVPAGATSPAASTAAAPAPKPSQAPGGAPTTGQQPAPAAGDEYGASLDKLAQQYNVDPALVRALAWIDTDGKPQRLDAPGGVGYLTVTDKTFEYIQQSLVKRTLDRANTTDNLEAGIAYVASMLKWGGEETKGLAGFLQGPGSVRTNGIRPAIDDQITRIQALRDRLQQGLPAPSTAAAPAQTVSAAPAASSASTPSAAPKLTNPGDAATLMARTMTAARTVAGADFRIGISGRNLVTGERLGVLADRSFPAASVGKLALLVELFRQTNGGGLALNDAQRNDLKAMIVASDNDAANRLMELLTTRAVNANLQAIGLAGTRLINPFGLARATGNPANVTTPADMTRLMELLVNEQLVSPQAGREMRNLLLQSNDGSKLRRGLPPEARLAHKSGWYDGVANDVGIVTHSQGSYILSVFTEGIPDGETANQTIAAVAETVHAAWGPKLTSTVGTEARRPTR
jgi:beta-lactamase class A/LysM repeat protein